MSSKSNQSEEVAKLLGTDAKPFITKENRKRLVEFDKKIKAVQREQKIIDAKSWEAASKFVLNS